MTAQNANLNSVRAALKAQERLQLIYTLLSAGLILVFLVTGFQFASDRSAGGLGKMFVDTWPHEIVFVQRSTGEEIEYETYVTPEFEDQYGERNDYPQRLKNLVAAETGLGGAEVVLVRDWHFYFNPINFAVYVRNIAQQLSGYLIRMVEDAISDPGRIFFFPAYKAGDADADATIFEGEGVQYCPWGQSYAEQRLEEAHAKGEIQGATGGSEASATSIFYAGDNGLGQQRVERREAEAALPCASALQMIQYQPKAAWVVYVWHED